MELEAQAVTTLIVLGIVACGVLLLTALIEDTARRARPTRACPEGCRCRGTAQHLRG